mmetsp:Transcript_54623/g.97484  ORF Transcript_54623/g.97484 Transcript_54623/m.97484 type:complete len:134 (-) Transcript_54623:97-498(-)
MATRCDGRRPRSPFLHCSLWNCQARRRCGSCLLLSATLFIVRLVPLAAFLECRDNLERAKFTAPALTSPHSLVPLVAANVGSEVQALDFSKVDLAASPAEQPEVALLAFLPFSALATFYVYRALKKIDETPPP